MHSVNIREILQLSPSERLQIVQQIWDSLLESEDQLPLTEAQKEELNRRWENYLRDPSGARTWDEVKEQMRRSQ